MAPSQSSEQWQQEAGQSNNKKTEQSEIPEIFLENYFKNSKRIQNEFTRVDSHGQRWWIWKSHICHFFIMSWIWKYLRHDNSTVKT